MLSKNDADNLSKTHSNENRAEFLVGKDLNTMLFEAIKKKDMTKVEHLVDYVIQNNKSIDLKNLKAAIFQADSQMIQLIIPHCGFSKPSDLYIPRELVITPGQNYENCVKLLLNWNFTVNPDSKEDEEFIYAAVENGYSPIVVQLLNFGIDVNMVNSAMGLNLLTVACLMKRHEIIKNLLKHNADVNVIIPSTNERWNKNSLLVYYIRLFTEFVSVIFEDQNLCDMTCLHIAVLNSDPKTTKLLMKYGAKITNDPKFFIITHLAIINGDEDIVRIFLDYGVNAADIGPQGKNFLHSFLYSDNDISNYIYYYSKKGRQICLENIAKWLLENGADIHLQTPGNSLVFEAITKWHLKIAQLFLKYNPDVQYVSSDGDTALHKAIKNHFNAEFIKTLLKLNSPVNIANGRGLTPLILACQSISYDRLEIVKALLHNNANVNCTDKSLRTPLHFACYDFNLTLVTLLLEKGANPNAKNVAGETPLHYACKIQSHDAVSIISLLLEHNANIEAMNVKGWTPLFMACRRNNDDTIKLLLENNAYVNHKDSENSTPLHISVKRGCVEITQLLIEYGGANIDILDNNNQTPLDIAEKRFLDFQYYTKGFLSHQYFRNGYYDEYGECTEIPSDKRHEYRVIKTLIVKYAVKLKIAGLKVNQRIIEDNSTLIGEEYKTLLEDKIKMMKLRHIGPTGITNKITFYDLLRKNIHFLSRLVKNDIILEALKDKLNQMEFPLYINIVRSRFRKAKIRCKLIDSAREYFRKNVYENLPDECIDLILSYSSIDELFNFIRAKIPLNG